MPNVCDLFQLLCYWERNCIHQLLIIYIYIYIVYGCHASLLFACCMLVYVYMCVRARVCLCVCSNISLCPSWIYNQLYSLLSVHSEWDIVGHVCLIWKLHVSFSVTILRCCLFYNFSAFRVSGDNDLIESILFDAQATRGVLASWLKENRDGTLNASASKKWVL